MEKINLEFLFKLRFESAERVIEFCMDVGLISRFYLCPRCGKNMTLRSRHEVSDRYEWVCRTKTNPSHRMKRSIRSGSYFEKSRMPIPDILLLTHFLVHRVEHKFVMYELNVCSHTVCDWHSYMREVYVDACLRMTEPIGGGGVIVEIDEFKLSKRKNAEERWVFGGVERGTDKCFFKIVERRDKETLLDIVQTYVLPGTTIYSDCWRSYKCLRDEEFARLTENHNIHFKNLESDVHTSAIGGTWAAMKRSLPSRTVSDQFDSYLAEYVWRRTHSDSGDLTRDFFQTVAFLYPPRSGDAGLIKYEIEEQDST